MNRCPANLYGNFSVGSPWSSTFGIEMFEARTVDTNSCGRLSSSKSPSHHARRGNRNTHPSVVRYASNSHPDPRCVSSFASMSGKESLITARASSSDRCRSASQGGDFNVAVPSANVSFRTVPVHHLGFNHIREAKYYSTRSSPAPPAPPSTALANPPLCYQPLLPSDCTHRYLARNLSDMET